MSEKQAKKLRKMAIKIATANWLQYASDISNWPFRVRLRFAWDILFRAKKYRLTNKKGGK